jgi:DNA-binding winged helix-turn-helix (wHTH) protein
VALTSGEFDILKTFAENPNRPLSRDWLLETTSHRSRDPFGRAIDLRITRLRRKIEPTPEKPTMIRAVRGIGYMFVPPAESPCFALRASQGGPLPSFSVGGRFRPTPPAMTCPLRRQRGGASRG